MNILLFLRLHSLRKYLALLFLNLSHELVHFNFKILKLYPEIGILSIVFLENRNEDFLIGLFFMADPLARQILLTLLTINLHHELTLYAVLV